MKSVVAVVLWLPVLASAATSYFCVADKATGMRFDKASKSWDTAKFSADAKFILSKPAKDDPAVSLATWIVKRVGEKAPSYTCEEDISQFRRLFCQGLGEFKFNQDNGRYLRTYTLGYYNDTPGKPSELLGAEGDNTPLVEIGRCSPIN